MAFCSKCGAKIEDAANFCSSCGAQVIKAEGQPAPQPEQQPGYQTEQPQPQPGSQPGQQQGQQPGPGNQQYPPYQNYTPGHQQPSGAPDFMNTDDYTSQYDVFDIHNNKGMGIISYLGILFLIPMFAAKNSPFAKFHVNQGLTLFIFEFGYYFVTRIILGITSLRFLWGTLILNNIFSAIFNLVGLVFLVFTVIGIINAANGKAKELPIIGNLRIFK